MTATSTTAIPPAAQRQPMLKSLHRLRGMAALAVVISHLMHWHSAPVLDHFDKMLCFSGTYAVGVFFVISGFIIARSHRREMGSFGRIGSYAIKRFFRIYPAYWAYSILFVAIGSLGFESWDHANVMGKNPLELVSAVFLVPLNGVPSGFLAVSWSLYYEILFYCVFAFFFINRKLGFSVLGLFALASFATHSNPLISPYCINRINSLFLAGVIIGLYADRVDLRRVPPIALTVAGVLCYAWSIFRTVQMNSHYVYASAVLLVAGAVAADLRDKNKDSETTCALGKGLMWLGTISYSLYLCHVPVQTVLYRLLGSPYQSPGVALLYTIAPVLIASAGYVLIEKPSQNLAKVFLSRSTRGAVLPVTPAPALCSPPVLPAAASLTSPSH